MRTSIVLATLTLLASTALAQNPIATPAGKNFETQDGGDQLAMGWNIGYAYGFANRATGHWQVVDDEINGTLRPIKGLSYRMDNKSHTTNSGVGRAWTNCTLQMAEVPWASVSTTFSNNLLNPTTVFSGSVTWPSYTGWISAARPPQPAPIQAAHKFPFSSTWIYTGTNAIVQDFTFSGGTLANGGSWTGTTTNYHLDGAIVVTSMASGAAAFPNGATCNDSAITGTGTSTAAQVVTQFNQYSKAYVGAKNNTVEIPVQTRYTAPNAPVIHGIGLAALNGGIGFPIGFACNNLILDVSLFFPIFQVAGPLPKAETPRYTLSGPRDATSLSANFWIQAAWTDSSTGRPSLTNARRARAPSTLGMTEVPIRKEMIESASTTATAGARIPFASWTRHPITLYDM